MILAGDVGGTKTNLGLFEFAAGRLVAKHIRSFRSASYAGLESLVEEFLGPAAGTIAVGSFGVPGPVIDGVVQVTNLPWLIDFSALQTRLGLTQLYLINDLQATAYGIAVLAPADLLVLNAGRPRAASNAGLLAAGTGLGQSILFWDGTRRVPSPSEGGHGDFAPHNALEVELFQYLAAQFGGHVSWERVLSGPGLVNLYEFLRDTGRGQEQASIAARMTKEDPAAVVSVAALENACGLCSQALDLFVSLYGAEAGNMALRAVALAGVYVGGGIAPKIRPRLTDGKFMAAFLDKGRMRPLLEEVPVLVILNDKTALLGAGYHAATHSVDSDR